MRPSRRNIRIATRRSRLAVAQSRAIGEQLLAANPRVALEMVPLESEGDRVRDHPLAALGGKGLFTRSIEAALLDNRADIAVHSLKDLPTEPTRGLVIAAIPHRPAPNDVMISPHGGRIEDLPHGAIIGTCSPRRGAQLLHRRPDLQIRPLRGNVETRLRRVLEEGKFDATLLASAGLLRLGLEAHTRNPIDCDLMLPAAAQAALAIQCRADDHVSMRRCLALNDPNASIAANAERLVVSKLHADCHSPVAALAEPIDANRWRIRCRVLSLDGRKCLQIDQTSDAAHLSRTCEKAAAELLDQGAGDILIEAARESAKV